MSQGNTPSSAVSCIEAGFPGASQEAAAKVKSPGASREGAIKPEPFLAFTSDQRFMIKLSDLDRGASDDDEERWGIRSHPHGFLSSF